MEAGLHARSVRSSAPTVRPVRVERERLADLAACTLRIAPFVRAADVGLRGPSGFAPQSRTSSVRASRTSTGATGPWVKAGVRIGKLSPGLLSRLKVPVQVTRTLAPWVCARS